MLFFILFGMKLSSQAQEINVVNGLSLMKNLSIMSSDSLNGFDESFHRAAALSDGFIGDEFHVYMYRSKREFIKSKYRLMETAIGSNIITDNTNYGGKKVGGNNIINAAPCVNEDFELNNFSGWTISSGVNNNSCAYNTCPTPGSAEAFIRTTPWADANFPGNTLPNSPLGGTRVAQLNNNVANGGLVTRIAQTFPVTPNNALFQFAYAAAFNSAHSCCQQPFLNIYVKNCQNQLLACPQISVVSPGPSCISPAPGFTNTGNIYKCLWQVRSLDLTAYIGSCVTIEVTVGDCSGWAHWGYVYFDALCTPMNLIVNGITFPAGTQASTVAACGANTATMTAPPGLQPYQWNGPPGSGITNNPNQTIVTSVGGVYTLQMNPPGSCAPIIKLVTLIFAPNPTAGIVSSNQCNVFTFTNTGSPAPSVQTFSFSGPGVVPGFTTTNLTNVVTFPVQGTYTVTQVVTTTAGCTASVQAIINVPLAPNVAFSVNSATQCFIGNSYVFTAANGAGVHSYSFSPGLGAPPIGNTPNYGPVSFSLPGTYTVTHSVTSGGCTSFSNMVVVINPMPTPTVGSNSPVCLNTSILLTALGGTSYAWTGPNSFTSAIQNPTITNATLAMNGTYSVLVTSVDGCTAMATTNVTVFAIPSPTIASNSPVCLGGILNFTASGGSNFNWTGPNGFTSTLTTPSIPNVQLPAGGVYTLMAGTGNCTATSMATIIINPLPVVTATNTSPVCENQAFNLSGGGAQVYTWLGPNAYAANGQNQLIANATLSHTGVYTVTGTDANSCVNTATTSVIINALPIITANNPTVCVGGNIALNGNGAATYTWTGPNNFSSNLQNPNIPNATPQMGGLYTLIGTSAQGCTAVTVSNVLIIALPVPTITANDPCFGGTLNLTGSGGVAYSWQGPNNFSSLGQNNTINNVSLLANGQYTLTVYAGGCSGITVADVTIHPLPNPVIAVTSPVCFSQPISFTATGGSSYEWYGPNSYSSNIANPIIASANHQVHDGIYTLIATDMYGCKNSTTASITVLPLPLVIVAGSTVCVGQRATAYSSGGVSYQWTGPNNFSANTATFDIGSLTPASAGIYTVVITGSNNCKVKVSTPLVNYPVPQPTASITGPVCLNEPVYMNSSGGHVYVWYGPNGFVSHSQNTQIKSANSVLYSGTYTLGVIDDKGCQGQTTVDLLIRPLPTGTIVNTAKTQCAPYCTSFKMESKSTLSTILWNMDSKGNVPELNFPYCFKEPGGYALVANFTDVYGCKNTASLVSAAYPSPLADFHIGSGAVIENEEVELIDASLGEYLANWTWYVNSTNISSYKRNTKMIFEKAGTYPVAMIVSNQWGCKDTIVKPVVVNEGFNIYVPNAFSPNGDGHNDFFQPKGYGIVKYNLVVFDRWGERLFSTDQFENGWDGKYKGQVCKDDTYIWKIVLTGADDKRRELAGTVTIIQ